MPARRWSASQPMRVDSSPARHSPTSGTARDRAPRRQAGSERSIDRPLTSAAELAQQRSRSGTNLVCTCTATGGRAALRAHELADHLLDAGVDVGAVEGGDAGVGEGAMSATGVAASTAPWPPASCQPPLITTREICSRARARFAAWDRSVVMAAARRCFGMAEPAQAEPRDAQARAAVRDRGRRPRRPSSSSRCGASAAAWPAAAAAPPPARRSRSPGRAADQHLAVQLEMVAGLVPQYIGRSAGDDLDAQIVELERVVARGHHGSRSMGRGA